MQWNKKPIDHDETKNLSKNFGINLIAASIFIRRNIIDSKNICYFLEQNVQFLHNPFLFSDMEAAVNRINSAIKNGEKIFVYGDRDVDGITSTILLFELLNEFNGNADWGLPIGDESYGVTKALIDKLKKKSITLLITVDCGISNFGEINYAAQNNIDTIIIDHHYPPEEIPKALAIINPKQKSSGYPFEGLSACGVVSKLEWALRFSQTKYYCKNFCLLNTRPLNNAFLIECVKLRNAILIDRINENLIPGMMSFSETRLFNFLENQDIIVFDEEKTIK
jgi:single-stranded-DNA-specific exonuclease